MKHFCIHCDNPEMTTQPWREATPEESASSPSIAAFGAKVCDAECGKCGAKGLLLDRYERASA